MWFWHFSIISKDGALRRTATPSSKRFASRAVRFSLTLSTLFRIGKPRRREVFQRCLLTERLGRSFLGASHVATLMISAAYAAPPPIYRTRETNIYDTLLLLDPFLPLSLRVATASVLTPMTLQFRFVCSGVKSARYQSPLSFPPSPPPNKSMEAATRGENTSEKHFDSRVSED